LEFVTRKISNAVAKIELGLEKELRLGSLSAKRDWGYAPEYVEAVWRIMQQKEPDDFIIATGEAHSVKDFAQIAFDAVGLDWQESVKVDQRFLRPLDVECLVGDFSKAKSRIGWSPKTRFEDLAKIMVKEDINRWQMWLNGERFPWDAPSYPRENRILTRALRM
jgi:GDPmannose 4,6-dehydratase